MTAIETAGLISKGIIGVGTAVGVIWGGYTGVASAIDVFATKTWVEAQNLETKRGLIDLQIQQNTVRRENLRGQLYTIESEQAKTGGVPLDPRTRQRLDNVKDDLQDADREREALRQKRDGR